MPTKKSPKTRSTKTPKKTIPSAIESLIFGMACTIYENLDGAKGNWMSAEEISKQPYEKIEWLMEQLSKQIKTPKKEIVRIVERVIHEYPRRLDWTYYPQIMWSALNEVKDVVHEVPQLPAIKSYQHAYGLAKLQATPPLTINSGNDLVSMLNVKIGDEKSYLHISADGLKAFKDGEPTFSIDRSGHVKGLTM